MSNKPKPDQGGLLPDEELVEKCMPTLERFEEVEKQVFYPIPTSPEFSAIIRIYASTMSREAVRKTLNKTASECQQKLKGIKEGIERQLFNLEGSIGNVDKRKYVTEAIKIIKAFWKEAGI